MGFSPLDDELGLLPGSLTPQAQAALVRLGAEREFAPAAELLAELTGIQISEATTRRHSYAVGELLLAEQTAAAPALAPPADPGPATQQRLQLSAAGAMIPLIGGNWVEVKTLVIGEVKLAAQADAAAVPHAQQLSYFSRLAPAEEFTRLAVVETQRRGVRAAAAVAGVMDGAPWLQGLLDYHRPDAVRILDQPHALGHLHQLAQALWADTATATQWWREQKRVLNEQQPAALLKVIEELAAQALDAASYSEHRNYLEARSEQMRYREFRAAGWPVGSGIVESGNKLVVERRLKGAGKRWAPAHVKPLLVLRNGLCSGRWREMWLAGAAARRRALAERRTQQRAGRYGKVADGSTQALAPQQEQQVDAVVVAAVQAILAQASEQQSKALSAPGRSSGQAAERWRPAPNHPWRRSPIGRACADPQQPLPNAKL